jgi:hypothetical protein
MLSAFWLMDLLSGKHTGPCLTGVLLCTTGEPWALSYQVGFSVSTPLSMHCRAMFDMIGWAGFATRFNALQNSDQPFLKVSHSPAGDV